MIDQVFDIGAEVYNDDWEKINSTEQSYEEPWLNMLLLIR